MMSHEYNKAVKMLEEVIAYFVSHRMMELEMNISIKSDVSIITVSGLTKTQPDDLNQLSQSLNNPRQPEVEEYYWRLLGGNNKTEQLHLLGALVDEANIMFDDHRLTITLTRKK